MPDGRMLSKSIAHSEQLAAVSMEADYLFARCIPHLDREGRMPGNPSLVKSIACPLRAEITAGLIPDLLRQLSGAGLVRWYECDGKQVVEFPGFHNHQKGARFDREAASRYPAYDCGKCKDLLRTYSGPTPAEVRVSEGEVKGEVEDTLPNGSGGEAADVIDAEVEILDPDERPSTEVRVIPLRPEHEITADTLRAVPLKLTTAQVLLAWAKRQHPPPDEEEKKKQGAAAKRLAEKHSGPALALAFLGMEQLFPYSEGEPWDLFDLERKFSKAKAAAANHPEVKEAREDAAMDAALDEALGDVA